MEDQIKLVISSKKERFNVEIRVKKRKCLLENKRNILTSLNEAKPLKETTNIDSLDEANIKSQTEVDSQVEYKFEEQQSINCEQIKNLFSCLSPDMLNQFNEDQTLIILKNIYNLFKSNLRLIGSFATEDYVERAISTFMYLLEFYQLNNQIQSQQGDELLIKLAHIIFYMSTTSHLPIHILTIGQLTLFEALFSHSNIILVQSGASILCNCISSDPQQIQYVMESNLFYLFKSILQSKKFTYQTHYIIYKLFWQYFEEQFNIQRQKESVRLLLECLPSNEENKMDADLICNICDALLQNQIEQYLLSEVCSNPQFIFKFQKLLRIYLKKNKNTVKCILEVLNEILEKQFTVVSPYLLSDFIKNLSKCCSLNDHQISEKVYYILSNLVADSHNFATIIASNDKINMSLISNAKKNRLGLTLEIIQLIKNLFIKIEAIQDLSSFIKQNSLISLFFQIIQNFQYSKDIVRNITRCLKITFQYCEFNQEYTLQDYCIRKILETDLMQSLEFYCQSADERISQYSTYVVDYISNVQQQQQYNNTFQHND